MTANELRVGNKFLFGKNKEVETFFTLTYDRTEGYLINGQIPESHCEPIPLTPELLEKCGFEEEYKSEFTIKHTNTKMPQFGYDWNKTFGWRVRYYGEHFNHVKYLHQLQNLFYSLTGQELQIEL
jgi:hypothetical protein